MRNTWITAVIAWAGIAAGCGGEAPGGGADAGDDAPPEVRSAQLSIDGALGVDIDFATRDVEHVLPRPESGTVVVRASDEASSEDLQVEVVDESGEPLPGQAAAYESGLWRIDIQLRPGIAIGVRVRDPAGNETVLETSITFPRLEAALADSWEVRFYDAERNVIHRWTSSFGDDGFWTESREDSGVERSGTFAVEGTDVSIEETQRSGGGDADGDPNTVEERQVSTLYVDSKYASARPFVRDGEGEDHVGTWTRSWSIHRPAADGLALAEEITETLRLADDGSFSFEREVVDHTGSEPSAATTTQTGSYSIELNEDYTDSAGNFLARSADTVDGEPVNETIESFELYAIRLNYLLIEPKLRSGL